MSSALRTGVAHARHSRSSSASPSAALRSIASEMGSSDASVSRLLDVTERTSPWSSCGASELSPKGSEMPASCINLWGERPQLLALATATSGSASATSTTAQVATAPKICSSSLGLSSLPLARRPPPHHSRRTTCTRARALRRASPRLAVTSEGTSWSSKGTRPGSAALSGASGLATRATAPAKRTMAVSAPLRCSWRMAAPRHESMPNCASKVSCQRSRCHRSIASEGPWLSGRLAGARLAGRRALGQQSSNSDLDAARKEGPCATSTALASALCRWSSWSSSRVRRILRPPVIACTSCSAPLAATRLQRTQSGTGSSAGSLRMRSWQQAGRAKACCARRYFPTLTLLSGSLAPT
mmetsp:Transcript_63586/g.137719  ORF Transcript_63586/g.137719 Transcript_63586/m.137719 type:complete len:356 (+) Transcript_63586:859-1926(+)